MISSQPKKVSTNEYLYIMNELKDVIDYIIPLKPEESNAFEEIFGLTELKKGDFLAKSGRKERIFGFVKSGVLRAYFTSKEGIEYNKTFFLENEFAGAYSSLVTRNVNYIDIQALEDSVLLTANYSDLLAIYDRFPRLERMARTIAEQYFVEKEKRELELVLLDAKQRYANFRQEYPGLENRIPQYHIASYLAITPTQLSRIRAKKAAPKSLPM